MFCKNCGHQINDEAVVCSMCGVPTENYQKDIGEKKKAGNGIAIAGFVCSFFIPLLGWIFGGVGLKKSSSVNGAGKGLSISAIVIASVIFTLNMIGLFV